MANEVYANGREIACKSGSGKVIAAFPDVCFTPPDKVPPTPPGVPIPYPVTSTASDTDKGTKKVVVSKKEVMKRDSSNFKKCAGDNAAQTAKKGMINSKLTGKVIFTSWSMNVKIEDKNALRHLDTATSNHSSPNANAAVPWVYIDSASMSNADCKEVVKEKNDCMEKHTKENVTDASKVRYKKNGVSDAAAKRSKVGGDDVDWDSLLQDDSSAPQAAVQRSFCKDEDCKDKLDCALVPYDGFCCPAPDKKTDPPVVSKTPHHVVPAHCFLEVGGRSEGEGETYDHVSNYKHKQAPCICLEGTGKGQDDEHGRVHETLDKVERDAMDSETILYKIGPKKNTVKEVKYTAAPWSFDEANDAGSAAVAEEKDGCKKDCLKKQSEVAHKNMMGDQLASDTPLRADPFGSAKPGFNPKPSAAPQVAAP